MDQGTTSSRAIIFDKKSGVISVSQKEFTQIYPQPGWVEHDPMEIWYSQRSVLTEVVSQSNINVSDIAAIGITNQRETTIVWDRNTGEPVYNAIVWQCRRTAKLCQQLKIDGHEQYIRENTGLVVDAYFSGTKIKWILDNVDGARARANRGELLFGTVDTWLLWNLTEGKSHITDMTNASRTMMYNINTLEWDDNLLDILDIPISMLPAVKSSSEIYGETYLSGVDRKIPISGIAGDQQSALFGQACFNPGDAKNTYGTGCFLLMNTGEKPVFSQNGLLTTIAISLNEEVNYALEGSVFIGGAAVQWLRDEMNLIKDAAESEYFANKVTSSNGVYVVPAFVGLGSPHWDMYARGCIVGLTRDSNKNHIIRATLESIAYQCKDLINAMQSDSEIALTQLKVDGGATSNDFLMQFQSDILDVDVLKPTVIETTALGAAYLAGLAVGFWDSKDEILTHWKLDKKFSPNSSSSKNDEAYKGWNKAVSKAKNWE